MFDGREPIYLQIAEQIREQVVSGALAEDEQVMSTTQYATTFRINPATAQKAFAELVEEGVLYKRRGLGMFVAPGARARLLEHRRARFFSEVVDPVAAQASVLGIDVDAVVERLREAYGAAPARSNDPSDGATDPEGGSR
ncbi:MAG: GntR family transcriptional regulator [Actinomycetota bacterium]|nr:GntR family transcriptional regulator [Actinomycetota bacterium]